MLLATDILFCWVGMTSVAAPPGRGDVPRGVVEPVGVVGPPSSKDEVGESLRLRIDMLCERPMGSPVCEVGVEGVASFKGASVDGTSPDSIEPRDSTMSTWLLVDVEGSGSESSAGLGDVSAREDSAGGPTEGSGVVAIAEGQEMSGVWSEVKLCRKAKMQRVSKCSVVGSEPLSLAL